MGETYIFGDVQGCYDSFRALVTRLGDTKSNSKPYDPDEDELWFAGDLINRGPGSLRMLEYLYRNRERVKVVLGNHDVHFIAVAEGLEPLKKGDTLECVLQSRKCRTYVEWLKEQPFYVCEGGVLMVHAGVWPTWKLDDLKSLGDQLSGALRDISSNKDVFVKSRGLKVTRYSPDLEQTEKLQLALKVLTTMRFLSPSMELLEAFKGKPQESPPGFIPWHQFKRNISKSVIYGHWAAQGLKLDNKSNAFGLDAGCVWGRELVCIRLSDRKIFRQSALEGPCS